MKKIVRQMGCLLCLLLCGLFYTNAAATEESVNTGATGTLTVSYTYGTDAESENNLALAGVSFRIYRIASIRSNGTYALTDDFEGCGLTNDELNSLEYAQDINAVLDTLVSWLKENSSGTVSETENAGSKKEGTDSETNAGNQNSIVTQTTITAAQEVVTDETGAAEFTNLQTGLYLLVGESLTVGEKLYTNSPSLVSIPVLNAEETGWDYEITVNAKAEETIVTSKPDPEPDTEPLTESVTEPDTEPQSEATTEPDTEPTTEPSTEAVTEPQPETPTESQTELPSETQTESPTVPQTEPSTEAVTESQPESQSDTESKTEAATEPLTETVTESQTEALTETELDAPTGKYIEPESDSSNSLVTENSSSVEVVTEIQTESETTDAVQTGDDTPVMAWLILLCGSCGILVAFGQQRKRMKKG